MRLAALLLLVACGPVPPNVAFERMAAARLQSCVSNNLCQYVRQCFAESEAFCVDAGYRPSCGFGEVEGSCGTGVK